MRKQLAVQDVDAIVTGVAGGGATIEIVTIGNRQMLPLKTLVDDQSLRPMNAQETAPTIMTVAAMAGGHSDQIARIDRRGRIGKIVTSVLSRYPEKKMKKPNISYLN
jgi:hypothetical protein